MNTTSLSSSIMAVVWHQADFVTRSLTLTLLMFSILSWAVILNKTYQLYALRHLDVSTMLTCSNHDPVHAVRRCLEIYRAQQQSGMAWLASCASVAPFLGLLGTVWGVYHALQGLGLQQTSGLQHIAGPVGEALIMTALGLAVAIPALLAYNLLGHAQARARMVVRHRLEDLNPSHD